MVPRTLGTVDVSLASRQDFENATIERSQILQRLQFTVDRRADSTPIIRVTSDQAISEPFLQFLVTVQWPGGKLIREYTALLDPPLYAGAQNANTVQSPDATVTESTTPAVDGEVIESEIVQIVEPSDLGVAEPSDSTIGVTTQQIDSEEVVVTGALESAVYAGSQITTRAGDTLTEIASTIPIPANVNLYQAMVAIQQANPSAFINGNMNRLKRDVELTIPDLTTGVVSRVQAREMFANQVREFEQYRQGVASSVPRQVEQTPAEPEAEPAEPTAATEDAVAEAETASESTEAGTTNESQTPVASTDTPQQEAEADTTEATQPNETVATDGRLKISKAETDADASERDKILDDLSQAEEQVFALDSENKELRERLALLESKVEQSTRLAQIEQARLAELETQARAAAKEREEAILREEAEAARVQQEQIAAAKRAEEQRLAAELAQQELNEQLAAVEKADPVPTQADTPQQPIAEQPAQPQPEVETAAAQPTEESAAVESTVTSTGEQSQAGQAPKESASFLETAKEKFDNVIAGDGDSAPGIGGKIAAAFSSITDTVRNFLAGSWAMMGAFGLIVLGLVGLIVWRRRRSIAEFEESILSGSALDIQTDTAETGTASTAATDTSFLSEFGVPGMGGMQTDEVDPIAEAEVYMAYGRDEQAEEVLKEAINRDSRPELKLKLLEIYRSRNEIKEFETLAEELYPAHGNEPDEIWRKVVEMGQQLSPDNPLFKGGVVAASAAAVGAAMASGGGTNAYSPTQQLDAVATATSAAGNDSAVVNEAFPQPRMDTSVDAKLDQLTQQAELANPNLEAFQVNDIERSGEISEVDFVTDGDDNGVDFEPSDSLTQTVAEDVLNLDASAGDSSDLVEDLAQSTDTVEFDFNDDVDQGIGAGLAAAGAAVGGLGASVADGVKDKLADAGDAVAGSKEKVRQVFESAGDDLDDGLSLSSLDDNDDIDTIELDNSASSDDADDALSLDIDGLSFDADDEQTLRLAEDEDESTIFGVAGSDGDSDNATKLDLAKAYRDMGDEVGARGFLEEVIQNGSEQQKQEAAELMAQIESA